MLRLFPQRLKPDSIDATKVVPFQTGLQHRVGNASTSVTDSLRQSTGTVRVDRAGMIRPVALLLVRRSGWTSGRMGFLQVSREFSHSSMPMVPSKERLVTIYSNRSC
jgi:hypothetical protein